MSAIYLVRHGQAGTRESYDSLSDLGRRQSRLLGEYFVAQGIEFAAAYAGGMSRQQRTAAEVSAAYADAGVSFPEVAIEQGWNEFDLDQIYQEIAPLLSAEDPNFRREYQAMREQVRASRGAQEAEVHRRWWPCDTKVVREWISGRYPYSGETWKQFRERVAACSMRILDGQPPASIAVFTTATPTAICTGMALDIGDQRVLGLAGVLLNASYTVVRLRREERRLFTFNAVPHLSKPELRTHR